MPYPILLVLGRPPCDPGSPGFISMTRTCEGFPNVHPVNIIETTHLSLISLVLSGTPVALSTRLRRRHAVWPNHSRMSQGSPRKARFCLMQTKNPMLCGCGPGMGRSASHQITLLSLHTPAKNRASHWWFAGYADPTSRGYHRMSSLSTLGRSFIR